MVGDVGICLENDAAWLVKQAERGSIKERNMRAEQETATAGDDVGAHGGKFLTFKLGAEEYGLEILKVAEIIGMLPITWVPRTPEFIRGVVNLRGKVIPIMDLRMKFGMETIETTDHTCIIVVQVKGIRIGVVVDEVSEVMDIADADIEDAPSFGAEVDTEYLLGIAKANGRVELLLDIEQVISAQDLAALRTAESSAVAG